MIYRSPQNLGEDPIVGGTMSSHVVDCSNCRCVLHNAIITRMRAGREWWNVRTMPQITVSRLGSSKFLCPDCRGPLISAVPVGQPYPELSEHQTEIRVEYCCLPCGRRFNRTDSADRAESGWTHLARTEGSTSYWEQCDAPERT